MKKRYKIFFLSLLVLLLIYLFWYINFLAPYNLQEKRSANGLGISNIKNIKELPEWNEYFRDYNISKVEYLGSDTYEVFTDKGNFIIMADYSDHEFWRYKIFRFEKEVEYFTNPM